MLRKLIFALAIPLTVSAQSDPQATAILKKVSEMNSGYKDLDIRFSYTLENKSANISDTRDGRLTLMGPKFHLQLMGQDIYSDSKIVWYDMKEDREVHVKTMDEFREETDIDPSSLFTQYEKGFKTQYNGQETYEGKKVDVIDLFPEIPGKKPYSRIRLGVEHGTGNIAYSKTFGKDGTDYLLKVNSFSGNSGADPKQFIFDAKAFEDAGYDVVDFR